MPDILPHTDECPGDSDCRCPAVNRLNAALSSDAGLGWLSPEAVDVLLADLRERCAHEALLVVGDGATSGPCVEIAKRISRVKTRHQNLAQNESPLREHGKENP